MFPITRVKGIQVGALSPSLESTINSVPLISMRRISVKKKGRWLISFAKHLLAVFHSLIHRHQVTGHHVSLYFCRSFVMTQQLVLLYLLSSSLLAGHVSLSNLSSD